MHTVTPDRCTAAGIVDTQSSYLTPREYDEYKKKIQSTSTGDSGITLSKRLLRHRDSVLPIAQRESGIHSGDILNPLAVLRRATCPLAGHEFADWTACSGVKVAVFAE